MGRSSPRWPRNSSPATAPRDAAAHGLRGRRRQAVDLQLPARRPAAPSLRDARHFEERVARRRPGAGAMVPLDDLVPLGAAPVLRAVDAVFARCAAARRRGRPTASADAPCRSARGQAGLRRAVAAGPPADPEPRAAVGCRRSTRRAASRAAQRGWPRAIAATIARLARRGELLEPRGRADAPRRHHGAGAPAQRLRRAIWCAR